MNGVIYYNINTVIDQSGSPIFIENKNSLIGIHQGLSIENNFTFGTAITSNVITIL